MASSVFATPKSIWFDVGFWASIVIFCGAVMLGGTVSWTVTDCTAEFELPEMSVAVHVTIVVPNGNISGASFVISVFPPHRLQMLYLVLSARLLDFDASNHYRNMDCHGHFR